MFYAEKPFKTLNTKIGPKGKHFGIFLFELK
jgi:hypothetical protein